MVLIEGRARPLPSTSTVVLLRTALPGPSGVGSGVSTCCCVVQCVVATTTEAVQY